MPKVRDAIRIVERDGWYWVRTRAAIGNIITSESRERLQLRDIRELMSPLAHGTKL